MSPAHITRAAALILAGSQVDCRYEHSAGKFYWRFYRGGHLIKSLSRPNAVIPAAQKYVDIDK